MNGALRLLTFPLVGAAIGWFTNYLAIKMLFKPRRGVKFLGFTFQGLIPKRRTELSHKLAETVTRDLIGSQDISDLLSKMDWEEEVTRILEKVIEEDLKKTGLKKFPVVGFMADNFLFHIKYVLAREITARLDRHRETIMERVDGQMDLKQVILDKVEAFDLGYMEELVLQMARRELRAIEIIGGVLGFLVGAAHVILDRVI
jgi:uncharacterized membrane protein YheB (UPF0754 family)